MNDLAYIELVRAVALANLEMPKENDLPRLAERQEPEGTVAYAPFAQEIARAIREGGPQRLPDRLAGERAQIYRPAPGLETPEGFGEAHSAMRDLLSGWLSGRPEPEFRRWQSRLVLRVGLEFERKSGVRGALNTSPTVRMFHIPRAGSHTFVYGVLLAADAGLLPRVSVCTACGRYIVGRTDRRVISCAEESCRGASVARTATAPTTREAAYQRRRRERQTEWLAFERGQLSPAVAAITAAASPQDREHTREQLQTLIGEAEVLLKKCFPHRKSAHRAAAEFSIQVSRAVYQASHKKDVQ